ncbi:MAG: cytochrome d ubiquinol oxidase subunit II, partial [Anaerolineae bacterium]|nr:cytochrome d ubiquinol oxidase subunit II [Anaerolineae bacterium]
INTIGPHWDGNEVWLILAGGTTFAAFPDWYATLFSGFYVALFLLLVGLILRGVAFEFRSKDAHPGWRRLWDGCIFVGSLVPALLLGVAFANLAKGVPIDGNKIYTGNLLTLLNPYALLGGLTLVVVFLLHGANFLCLKLTGELHERARRLARRLWPVSLVFLAALMIAILVVTDLYARLGIASLLLPIGALAALLLAGYATTKEREGWSFVLAALAVVLIPGSFFVTMFPRLMISSTNADYSLTIYNASSSPYTLKAISIVALIFVPIVLAYQAWSYWIFRQRIQAEPKSLTY